MQKPDLSIPCMGVMSRFEEAFNQALHIGDIDLVDWLCEQVDPGDLCSREPPPLSQGVLLSLVSQLSTDLSQASCLILSHMLPYPLTPTDTKVL